MDRACRTETSLSGALVSKNEASGRQDLSRREFMGKAVGALGLGLATAGCVAGPASPQIAPRLSESSLGARAAELSRLAGQTLMVGFVGTDPGDSGTAALADQIAAGEVGAVLLVARNIESSAQLSELTGHLQGTTRDQRLLIAIDNEGGAVTRTAGKPGFSEWMPASAVPNVLGTPAAAREYYRARAAELKAAGINFNLAPVVDLNVNPSSPAIGRLGRSLSADPAVVVEYATAIVHGHHDAGLLTSVKHFPGHGSATRDTHRGLTDVSATWQNAELQPFVEMVRRGSADSMMLSHLIHPVLSTDSQTPLSLSPQAATFLRSQIGFSGPIISDDLQMGAIEARWSDEDAAVLALAAGNDLVILSNYEMQDPTLGSRINAAIVRAVLDGRLPEERLLDASYRVRALKDRL